MSIDIELSARQIATGDLKPFLLRRSEILDGGICDIFADPSRYLHEVDDDFELRRYCTELLRVWPGLCGHCESGALSFLAQAVGHIHMRGIVSPIVCDDLRSAGCRIPKWLFESTQTARQAA